VANAQYSELGKITYTDFLIATLDWKRFADEDTLWVAFKHLDPHNRELLTVEGLREVFTRSGIEVGEEEFDHIVTDLNLRGHELTFEEFKGLMKRLLSQSRPQSASSSLRLS
jgi:Ca2+-binding EF-hand superfamily protein